MIGGGVLGVGFTFFNELPKNKSSFCILSFEFVVVGFSDLEFVVGHELLVGLTSVVSMDDFSFCDFSIWSLVVGFSTSTSFGILPGRDSLFVDISV